MDAYVTETNVPPQYAFGMLDDKGKFKSLDINNPSEYVLGSFIKVAKGVPAKLNPETARGIKQNRKKANKQQKLKEQHGIK